MLRNFLLVFLLIISSGCVAWAERLTFVADSWCPYNCTPGSQREGILIEIIKQVFEARGFTVEYRVSSWSRAIKDARRGKYTGIVGAFHDDAPDFVFSSHPIIESQQAFFAERKSTWQYTGIPSLSKVSLGVIQDYSYAPELDKYIQKNKNNPRLIQVSSGEEALKNIIKKTLLGRISAFVEDSRVEEYVARSMGVDGQLKAVGVLVTQDVFVAFSPANVRSGEFAVMLEEGIVELKQSGKFDQILSRYGVSLPTPQSPNI